MFVFYDWPFLHLYFANNVANIIFPFNYWPSFQRLCRLLWENALSLHLHYMKDCHFLNQHKSKTTV